MSSTGFCAVCGFEVTEGTMSQHQQSVVHAMNEAIAECRPKPAVSLGAWQNVLAEEEAEDADRDDEASGPAPIRIKKPVPQSPAASNRYPWLSGCRCTVCDCVVLPTDERSHDADLAHAMNMALRGVRMGPANPQPAPSKQPPVERHAPPVANGRHKVPSSGVAVHAAPATHKHSAPSPSPANPPTAVSIRVGSQPAVATNSWPPATFVSTVPQVSKSPTPVQAPTSSGIRDAHHEPPAKSRYEIKVQIDHSRRHDLPSAPPTVVHRASAPADVAPTVRVAPQSRFGGGTTSMPPSSIGTGAVPLHSPVNSIPEYYQGNRCTICDVRVLPEFQSAHETDRNHKAMLAVYQSRGSATAARRVDVEPATKQVEPPAPQLLPSAATATPTGSAENVAASTSRGANGVVRLSKSLFAQARASTAVAALAASLNETPVKTPIVSSPDASLGAPQVPQAEFADPWDLSGISAKAPTWGLLPSTLAPQVSQPSTSMPQDDPSERRSHPLPVQAQRHLEHGTVGMPPPTLTVQVGRQLHTSVPPPQNAPPPPYLVHVQNAAAPPRYDPAQPLLALPSPTAPKVAVHGPGAAVSIW